MNWNGFVAFFHADDLKATHDFYHDVLGLPLYKDQGDCMIYQVKEGSYLEFCTHFPSADPDGSIVTLLTDDVDEAYELLRSHPSVTVESAPRVNEKFKIYHFFARDPDGYKVEVQKFLS